MSAIYTMPGHLIRRLQQISVSIFSEQMRSEGIDMTSPQFAALAILEEHPGIDQATLAGLIALDRPTIGGVIDRLAAKGLVARKVSETDRRAKQLALTPEGTAMVARMRPLVEATQSKVLDGLSADEQAQFTALAEKIARLHNDQSRAPLVMPKRKSAPPA
ncbi:MarR family transcriptional regulator [Gymnodinialimonas sp. 57CJ19]|uniref:MarR family winged helix-turn-helix transcriptional regulator n=1 Tax=Gymnodinialimonas sp. 57CJ19 TaxID=3138498 RepID=UPI003134493F